MLDVEATHAAIGGLLFGLSLTFSFGPRTLCLIRCGVTRNQPIAAASAACACDVLLVGAGVGGVGRVAANNPYLMTCLQLGGIAFLCWFARRRLIAARTSERGGLPEQPSAIGEILRATWLNPLAYTEAVFLVGILAASYGPDTALAFGAGYLTASVIRYFGWSLAGWRLSPWLGRPLTLRRFDLLSASFLLVAASLLAINLAGKAYTAGRLDAPAAVDLQRHAGDEFGLVGAEPERRIGDVERGGEAAERNDGFELGAPLGRILAHEG